MRRLILAFLCAGLVAFVTVGCKRGDSGGGASQPQGRPAMTFKDGHEKYDDMQFICPVCGKEGLKQELHVDTEKGRVYFDKKECMEEFNGKEDEYLKKYEQMKRMPPGSQEYEGEGGGS